MKTKKFREFILESQDDVMSPEEINDYISDLTPNDSDVPDYFMDLIKKSGKKFELKTVQIQDLLKSDKALEEYVNSGEKRYGENGVSDIEPYEEDLDNPIVIFNDEVVDGYSRTSTLFHRGEKTIKAWVSK